jgi:hypothetical protein
MLCCNNWKESLYTGYDVLEEGDLMDKILL